MRVPLITTLDLLAEQYVASGVAGAATGISTKRQVNDTLAFLEEKGWSRVRKQR